jgi:hypothetical protein
LWSRQLQAEKDLQVNILQDDQKQNKELAKVLKFSISASNKNENFR